MDGDVEIVIEADGTIQTIHDDDVAALFAGETVRTFRASHVEPGDGGWTADLTPIGGPVLGPYARRDIALMMERFYIGTVMTRRQVTEQRS